jgi:TPR repeat protein
MSKYVLAALGLLAAIACYAGYTGWWAGPERFYGQGLEREARGEAQKAFRDFEKAAVKGSAEAQFKVAEYYREGLLGQKDYGKALSWTIEAAERGHPGAQLSLGLHYDSGPLETADPILAASWLSKAAQNGLAAAQGLTELDYVLHVIDGQGRAVTSRFGEEKTEQPETAEAKEPLDGPAPEAGEPSEAEAAD